MHGDYGKYVPMNTVSPERNSTGMDKIMETLDSIGIKLLLLAALKER
jgi:hypothetical protein